MLLERKRKLVWTYMLVFLIVGGGAKRKGGQIKGEGVKKRKVGRKQSKKEGEMVEVVKEEEDKAGMKGGVEAEIAVESQFS